MRTLVLGATGFVGRRLVPALVAAGHDVVAGVRRPDSYDGPEGVRAVRADVEERGSVARAVAEAGGCDAIHLLVHGMASGGDFAAREAESAHDIAAAASGAGARVVYLGGLGGPESDAVSPHLRSRHEVGRILRGECDAVELRAGMVIGRGGASFEILRQLVEHLPLMVCPVWVTTKAQVIALDDAVRYLVGALDIPCDSYDLGMDEVLTYEQMMNRYADLTGRRRVIVKVPFFTPGLSSHWIGLVTDQPSSVARPLAEGLKVDVLVRDGGKIRDLVPFEPMGFDAAIRRAIEPASPDVPSGSR